MKAIDRKRQLVVRLAKSRARARELSRSSAPGEKRAATADREIEVSSLEYEITSCPSSIPYSLHDYKVFISQYMKKS